MKVVVDRLPESPRECMFFKNDADLGCICTLRPIRLCKLVNVGVQCGRLTTFKKMMEENNVRQND